MNFKKLIIFTYYLTFIIMGKHSKIEGDTPRDFWGQVTAAGDRRLLTAPEVVDLRIFVAQQASMGAGLNLDTMSINFENGGKLVRAINDFCGEGVNPWSDRLTTSTHFVKKEGGYRFYHGVKVKVVDDIVDGGVFYSEEMLSDAQEGGYLSEEVYRSNPGGCYEVADWGKHVVVRALLDNLNERLLAYVQILKITSQVRLGAVGKESVWCPQDLPENYGRAWAIGVGADSAYPPNNTTRGHWGLLEGGV